MKKILVALALAAVASTASAAISGGPHDLSKKAGATLGSCQYCHAPHVWTATNITTVGTPLWNRNVNLTGQVPYGTTVALSWSTPGPMSQTCLSCHNGLTDLGSVVNGGPGGTLGTLNAATHSVGTDLTNDHPVGITMVSNSSYQIPASNVYPLFSGAIECSSCHEPHTGGVGSKFLRTSGIINCSACHLK
jgi:predicted CXXCH cytochrome family protein